MDLQARRGARPIPGLAEAGRPDADLVLSENIIGWQPIHWTRYLLDMIPGVGYS
jgi:hypothetical protein